MNANDLANKILIIGVPVSLSLCAWGLTEIIHNGKSIERMVAVVEGLQREINNQDRRINRIEDTYMGKHP